MEKSQNSKRKRKEKEISNENEVNIQNDLIEVQKLSNLLFSSTSNQKKQKKKNNNNNNTSLSSSLSSSLTTSTSRIISSNNNNNNNDNNDNNNHEENSLNSLQIDDIIEVKELKTNEVILTIEEMVIKYIQQILENGLIEMNIPNRGETNQRYIEELDRNVLGNKVSKRTSTNSSHVRKIAITSRVLQLIHEVLSKGIHITKRDLFYTDVKLFTDQSDSDSVLDDIACMVGCTRTSLHVVASDKGLVVGRIQYLEDGDSIDCTKMGVGGKAIPPYIDRVTNIQSDAQFIILVEKEAAYMRLAEDRFYNKYPCIIITGKGQPDVASRLFLRKIRDQLRIPVLALVDSDPYGLKILSVYCSGSKGMSYDSNHLTTSDIKWLGIRPSDLDKYHLPAQCRLPMTEHDRKMGTELLKEPFIQKNPQWVEELEIMLRTGEKAEIQALSSFGFQFITQEFLPRKLREGDWL